MPVTYTNVAGKLEYDEEKLDYVENFKFIGEAHTDVKLALADFDKSAGYHFNRIEVHDGDKKLPDLDLDLFPKEK